MIPFSLVCFLGISVAAIAHGYATQVVQAFLVGVVAYVLVREWIEERHVHQWWTDQVAQLKQTLEKKP